MTPEELFRQVLENPPDPRRIFKNYQEILTSIILVDPDTDLESIDPIELALGDLQVLGWELDRIEEHQENTIQLKEYLERAKATFKSIEICLIEYEKRKKG